MFTSGVVPADEPEMNISCGDIEYGASSSEWPLPTGDIFTPIELHGTALFLQAEVSQPRSLCNLKSVDVFKTVHRLAFLEPDKVSPRLYLLL
jgi:hypothetical protein